jgi:hypothetical protein
MNKSLIELEFYETYYYANILSNIIENPFSYIRGIHEWYENCEEEVFLAAFPKFSRLHGFAAHIIDSLISEQINDSEVNDFSKVAGRDVWIDRALKYHGFRCDGFADFVNMGENLFLKLARMIYTIIIKN